MISSEIPKKEFFFEIIASILTIHKLGVSKRRFQATNAQNFEREYQFEREYAKPLIIIDLLLVIFRLPTVINYVADE